MIPNWFAEDSGIAPLPDRERGVFLTWSEIEKLLILLEGNASGRRRASQAIRVWMSRRP